MQWLGHTELAGLAERPFPVRNSLEVKVSSQTDGQISRSAHVIKLPPLVYFAFPTRTTCPAPSVTFGQWGPWVGTGGSYGGLGCCELQRLRQTLTIPVGT